MSMEVRRIRTNGGSRIEPPLDQTWSNQEKLEWQAAVVSADSGLLVTVRPASSQYRRFGRWIPVPDEYDIEFEGGCVGSFPYRSAWVFLAGISLGAELSQRCEP